MKIKTSELQGVALDWAVAKCEAHPNISGLHPDGGVRIISGARFNPSGLWADGGPIIERERLEIRIGNPLFFPKGNERGEYYEPLWLCKKQHGRTPLIATMRCYVASKLGGEVEIPDKLMRNL
jgi:hypothetical protein